MSKPSRILLYYDGTREARVALQRAADFAHALDAHTDVLAVVDTGAALAATGWYLSDLACATIQDQALITLREALDHMAGNGIEAKGHVAFGDVVDSISRHAGMLNSDMLVVGHRPRGKLARWLGGGYAHTDLVERCSGRVVVTIPCD